MPTTQNTDSSRDKLARFYAAYFKLVMDLAEWVPEFYSDLSLVLYCATYVYLRGSGNERRFCYPNIVPSLKTEEAVYLAAALDIHHWNAASMGEPVDRAVRGILDTMPESAWNTPRDNLIQRLSFVTPKILPFPQELRHDERDFSKSLCAVADLCIYLAKRLLRHHVVRSAPSPSFLAQLTKLSQCEEHRPLDCLIESFSGHPHPTGLASPQFDAVEYAALELTAEQDRGVSPSRYRAQTLATAVNVLSDMLAASPPFPNLLEGFTQHYSQECADSATQPPALPRIPQTTSTPAGRNGHAEKKSNDQLPIKPDSSADKIKFARRNGFHVPRRLIWPDDDFPGRS